MELKIHDQEVHLQRSWFDYGLKRHEFTSLAGSRIEVLSVGMLNHDAGPDFKDAVIRVDGRLLQGDVEVHLDSSGWYAHKHASDPAYNRVILHVVSEQSSDDLFIEREDGVLVHQIVIDYMEDAGTETNWSAASEFKKVVDCPLSKNNTSTILNAISNAAQLRFVEKAAQLKEDLLWTTWEQLIFIKICEALGYSKNRKPFRKLAERLNFEKVRQVMQWVPEEAALARCAALLFGTAGLLESGHVKAFMLTRRLEDLQNHWHHFKHTMQIKTMYAHEWQFFRLRPHNFPTRRLAGLAVLLHRFSRNGFMEGFTRMVQSQKSNRKLLANLQSALIVTDTGDFTSTKPSDTRNKPALIGRERAKDIVINIILPVMYLYFENAKAGQLKNSVLECYRCSPRLSENNITRSMCQQLHVDGTKNRIVNSAYGQQGLLYLYKSFCRYEKCQVCLQKIAVNARNL